MTDGDEVATRLEHEMAVGSGAAQRLQRPTRPMPEGKTAWRRRERDVVTRRSDACARERRAEGDNRTHQHTLENFSSGVQPEWRKTHGPAAAVRAGPGWGAPETRVWRATGAAVFIERVRPPADATHRSFYPFVNNPLLAHPAGSNWPAPAGARALRCRWALAAGVGRVWSFLVRLI